MGEHARSLETPRHGIVAVDGQIEGQPVEGAAGRELDLADRAGPVHGGEIGPRQGHHRHGLFSGAG